jgi:hypothetical protein
MGGPTTKWSRSYSRFWEETRELEMKEEETDHGKDGLKSFPPEDFSAHLLSPHTFLVGREKALMNNAKTSL